MLECCIHKVCTGVTNCGTMLIRYVLVRRFLVFARDERIHSCQHIFLDMFDVHNILELQIPKRIYLLWVSVNSKIVRKVCNAANTFLLRKSELCSENSNYRRGLYPLVIVKFRTTTNFNFNFNTYFLPLLNELLLHIFVNI